jgi:hypothetical protein
LIFTGDGILKQKLKTMLMDRIRLPAPPELSGLILPCSVPIVYYGNYEKARACTIGINPGYAEFNPERWKKRNGKHPLHKLLCKKSLTEKDGEEIKAYYDAYFDFNAYPENNIPWFTGLECFCREFDQDYSYRSGTLVHIDVVPWVTDPLWGRLPGAEKKKLLAAERETKLFESLLKNKKWGHIFVNGSTALEATRLLFKWGNPIPVCFQGANKKEREGICYQTRFHDSTVIGWNLFIGTGAGNGRVRIDNDNTYVKRLAWAVNAIK